MTLARLVGEARRRARRGEAVREGLASVASVLAAGLAAAWADNLVHLPALPRLAIGLGIAALAGAGVLRAARAIARRRSDAAVALGAERAIGIGDNLLVNAVLLARDPGPARNGSAAIRDALVRQAEGRAAGWAAGLPPLDRIPRRLAAAAAGAILAAGIYAALAPEHAANALSRLARPYADIPPLSDLRFSLAPSPARVLAGDDLAVQADVRSVGGVPPAAATAVLGAGGAVRRIPMAAAPAVKGRPSERSFTAVLPAVERSGEWRVEAGGARSAAARVDVVAPPCPVGVAWTIRSPAYAGRPDEVLRGDVKSIRVLAGAEVALSFRTSPPARAAILSAGGKSATLRPAGGGFSAALRASVPATLRLDLEDPSGLVKRGVLGVEVSILPDRLPDVAFDGMPAAQILPPGATLPVRLSASDDVGLKALRVTVREGEPDASPAPPARVAKAWDYGAPGPRLARETVPLRLDPPAFEPGRAYTLVAAASDGAPGASRETVSAPIVVRVSNPGDVAIRAGSPLASFLEELKRLLEMQREAISLSGNLREFLDEHWAAGRVASRARDLEGRQRGIRDRAAALASRMRRTPGAEEPGARLSVLAAGPMERVGAPLEAARRATAKGFAGSSIERARAIQKEILDALAALLGGVAEADRRIAEAERKRKGEGPGAAPPEAAPALAQDLKRFLDEQRKVIETSQALDRKSPDDLTGKDDHLLSDAAAKEAEWAKWFRDAREDLSRLPKQDFADSTLADEWNEAYMEIQKAADALSQGKTEVAVPREQAGLELAEKIETNLERWLPDTPDTQRWTMEEPASEAEVPLADLPSELEDIVGDLLDDESKMSEEVEDATSSWMDSLDKGAGWDAMDGPISNMSAKGVTGNRLPNEQEVGGRSGEGRTGRSSGQFVEKEAQGKGGRETPTRLTEDPFEAGSVKNTGAEAKGGSTGGGKLSGGAGEGLKGAPRPPTPEAFDRLAAKQSEIRQKAERVSRHLEAYRLPSSDLDVAARRMRETEEALKGGNVGAVRQAVHEAVEGLRASKTALAASARWAEEKGADLPPEVRREILTGVRDEPPEAFRDLVGAYYKALAERGVAP